MADAPAVPITLEGAYVLHQMFRIRRPEWRRLDAAQRSKTMDEAADWLANREQRAIEGRTQSALYSQLGHKGDLIFLHFGDTLDRVHDVELQMSRLVLADYLEPTYSYLSVVELGLYESSVKTYSQLHEQNIEPHSPEWDTAIRDVAARQSAAMESRLHPEIPGNKYLCFYPMDRRRGEQKNWYQEPMPERQRMMHEHGLIGRRYAGTVRQIITGSIGFDDWEWGVDLFADDPLVFKKLIYEMRFDEVSAVYALFGAFHVGLRVSAAELGRILPA